MSKMASHEPFGHLQHKLWLKEGSAVKLIVWLPTTKKSGIDPILVCAGEVRHNFEESYNFGLDLVPIRVRGEKLWASKVPRVQTEIISGLHFGSLGKKSHLDASVVESCTEYYMGKVVASPESGPWWVKWVQGCPWLVPTPKGCRMSSNQLVVGFGCRTT